MMAVIADDFTGAAELGGIGLRYGLQVEINTAVNTRSNADLLIVAADTRSMGREEAALEMERLTTALLPLKPVLLYKKVDSVLRGHVAAEMRAQMKVLGLTKALLVPANPKLERTIKDGIYYLQGRPVHLSSFSHDPEYAITSSDVQDMLRTREESMVGETPVSFTGKKTLAGKNSIIIRKIEDPLPPEGIVVGEVSTTADLVEWAARLDGHTFAAGASGFFAAILDKIHAEDLAAGKQRSQAYSALASGHPGLIVCGSTFHQSRETIQKISLKGGPVSYMPAHLASLQPDTEADYDQWADEVVSLIRSTGRAIIAVNPGHIDAPAAARLLRERTARLVQKVLERTPIRELFIEGGSTAYAILRQTGLHTFFPIEEMAAGVIRMRAGENPSLSVTVKPGSYTWPASTGI
jgi:uncharacterized protein YgbK (DUF1537 family)